MKRDGWRCCVGAEESTGEYCAFEHFNASCRSPNERIYIRSAQYGRMRVGRCVKVDLGYLGCAADVRHVIEARCSGRLRCSVAVGDVELRTRSPCPTDVTWYLQVSYACVTGQCPLVSPIAWTYHIYFFLFFFSPHILSWCSQQSPIIAVRSAKSPHIPT